MTDCGVASVRLPHGMVRLPHGGPHAGADGADSRGGQRRWHAGIQLAKALGARVLTSAGSDERVARGCELGAEAGVNYSSQDVTEELLRLTGGRGVDMALDTVGGSIFDGTLRALAEGGHVVTVGGHTGQRDRVR